VGLAFEFPMAREDKIEALLKYSELIF
jgi:hypothetical protein